MRSPLFRSSVSPRAATQPSTLQALNGLTRNLALMTIGGSMMLGGILLIGLWRQGDQFLGNVLGWLRPAPPVPQVDVRSVVVKQVQEASELTTAVFTMEAVVPTQQQANWVGLTIGTTKLLYVAHGQVRAGVDLSQIQPQDIQAQGDQLTIRLPAPRILDNKIDITQSKVYDYNRGFLGLGPDVAPSLQTLAQEKALERIITAACQEGILNKANDRAKFVVSQLVKVPAYSNVTIQLTPPSECPTPVSTVAPPSATPPSTAPQP